MIQKKYKTKRDMILALMKKEILSGELKPRTRLLISEVASRYEVSEIPVREAFQVLIQEDLVRSTGAGFEVTPLSRQDIKEIFQIRISLECLASQLAVQNISNKQIDMLEEMIDRMISYVDEEDLVTYWNENRKFHLKIYEISENTRLSHMIKSLYDFSVRYPSWYTQKEELVNSVKEHREILEAFRKRDEQQVVELIRTHTTDSYYHVLKRMEEKKIYD